MSFFTNCAKAPYKRMNNLCFGIMNKNSKLQLYCCWLYIKPHMKGLQHICSICKTATYHHCLHSDSETHKTPNLFLSGAGL